MGKPLSKNAPATLPFIIFMLSLDSLDCLDAMSWSASEDIASFFLLDAREARNCLIAARTYFVQRRCNRKKKMNFAQYVRVSIYIETYLKDLNVPPPPTLGT
ncbi:hypothetical protein F4778DRAFT_760054 [Xylariomycetidae sp. FL2044]|nr:hypothetical protein F4778DRAFT_760054 [Xylariomycetidae sp. FL2044]